MHNTDKRTYKLVAASIIGAAYAALTIALAPISYSPLLQFRISEVLCILPFFFPNSAWGLFVGCAIANLLGGYGVFDVVFGSLATLLAGLCTAKIGKSAALRIESVKKAGWGSCIAACAMPVVFNIPIIGAVMAYTIGELAFWEGFVLYGFNVGIGEAAVLFVLGLPLMRFILANDRAMKFFVALR